MGNTTLSKYFNELKLDPCYEDYLNLSAKEVSDYVGISWESFRKNYYTDRKLNRDFIIAVFAVQKLGTNDINDFISKYDSNMPLISDEEACERDVLISDFLESNNMKKSVVTSYNLNEILKTNGFNELDLNLLNKNGSSKDNYRVEFVNIKIDEFATYDIYQSIESEYSIERFHYNGEMGIIDKHTDERFILSCFRNHYSIAPVINGYSDKTKAIRFQSINDSGKFIKCFELLKTKVDGKTKASRDILNDTKNYKERFGARFKDGSMYYFAETFNYSFPEIGEYYLLELIDNKWTFSVSNKSMFMHSFLSDNEYKRNYRNLDAEITCYNDKGKIKKIIESLLPIDGEIYTLRLKAWNKLENTIKESRDKIKNRKLYIRNLREIYDGDFDCILKKYSVDKEFECYNDGDFYAAKNDKILYSPDERKKIIIKLTDMYRAYELGLNDMKEIYDVVAKNKNIDNII